jgi:hypothetical protein
MPTGVRDGTSVTATTTATVRHRPYPRRHDDLHHPLRRALVIGWSGQIILRGPASRSIAQRHTSGLIAREWSDRAVCCSAGRWHRAGWLQLGPTVSPASLATTGRSRPGRDHRSPTQIPTASTTTPTTHQHDGGVQPRCEDLGSASCRSALAYRRMSGEHGPMDHGSAPLSGPAVPTRWVVYFDDGRRRARQVFGVEPIDNAPFFQRLPGRAEWSIELEHEHVLRVD